MGSIISFGIIIVALLVITHLYLWFSIIRFFNITKRFWKIGILIVTLLLTFSFPFSLFLVHTYENFFTSAYYAITGVWVGLLINLLMATIPAWIIIVVTKIINHKQTFNLKKVIQIITISLFGFAFIYTGYGVWNAQHFVIKTIEIPMKNLPKEWENKPIIQISDVHIGAINQAGFMQKVVDSVNAQNPELILITGDLFDGMDGNFDSIPEVLNKFQSKRGTYFITGNHETYIGLDGTLNVLKKTNIRVLNDEIVNLNGLQLIGISYPSFGSSPKDINKIIQPGKNFNPNKPSILLYHTPTSIDFSTPTSRTSAYWSPDYNYTVAKNFGIKLQLSGHTHAGQIFPFTLLTHDIFNGYDYGLHTDGDFNVYITSGVGTWGPPIRTGNDPEIVVIKLVNKP